MSTSENLLIILSAGIKTFFNFEVSIAKQYIPAALAAFIPCKESSNAIHSSGLKPSFFAAYKYMSGFGLPMSFTIVMLYICSPKNFFKFKIESTLSRPTWLEFVAIAVGIPLIFKNLKFFKT